MTTTKKLRHVVIGVGAGIFRAHQRVLGPLETAEVVAVADINETAGKERAAELDCAFYQDHKQMLAETKPDVAVIVTPHPFHASLSIDSLRAGAHVLVEKPMAVHVAEADAMVQAATESDRLLAINFQQRFRKEVVAVRKLLDEGALGEIQHVEMMTTWPRTAGYFAFAGWRGTWRGEGGGVLMNQAPHNLDMLTYLAGPPSRVAAWARTNVHNIETEDTVQAMIEWPNGAMGSMHTSTAEHGTPFRFEITGTKGVMRWHQSGITFQQFETDMRTHIAESDSMYRGPAIEEVAVELSETQGTHEEVYQNLHEAIFHGTPLMASGEDAVHSLELANAMIYSSHMGSEVELPLDREKYHALLTKLQAGS